MILCGYAPKLLPDGKQHRPTAAGAVNENPVLLAAHSAIFGGHEDRAENFAAGPIEGRKSGRKASGQDTHVNHGWHPPADCQPSLFSKMPLHQPGCQACCSANHPFTVT
jgi:hypothetical protein